MNNTYENIVIDIINKISEGRLKPGDKLDSEKKMIDDYQVSKMTVRKAINSLNSIEVIESRERVGAFVKSKSITQTSSNTFVLGYTMLATLKGLTSFSEVLEFDVIKPTKDIAEKLNIELDDDIYYIKRLRYLNEVPSAIELTYLDKSQLQNLQVQDLKSSLYDKLYNEQNKLIENVSANIEAIIPTKDLVAQLKLEKNEAVFLISQVSKISDERNFEYVLSFQAGSRINI